MRAASAALIISAAFLGPALFAEPEDALALAKQQLAAHDCRAAVRTLDDALPEAQAIEDEEEQVEALSALHFYSALALSDCAQPQKAEEHLREFFRLHPGHSSLDRAKFGDAFVAMFDGVQRSLVAGEQHAPATGEMFARFYPGFDQNAYAAEESLSLQLWTTSSAFLLLADDAEREEWGRLRDDEARAAFVERFWKRRDPDPSTDENELRAEIATRIAFADRFFVTPEEPRGSLTDRGRVFVLLGVPSRVYRKALQRYETTFATPRARVPLSGMMERWVYFKPQLHGVAAQQVEFRFITQPGYGESVMQRDFWPLKAIAAARQPRR